jgi:predicted peptidase
VKRTLPIVLLGLAALVPLSLARGDDAAAKKPDAQPGQRARKFEKEVKLTVKADYLLFLPEGYGQDPAKKWPVILFLHGAGERGSDVNRVKAHGPPKIVEQKKDFPFIVISPQCPEDQWWDPELLIALLDDVSATHAVDADRVYLTGLSMGGFGTWATAIRYPDRFAAIAPICGGGSKFQVRRIRHVPAWVFHGDKDEAVPVGASIEMVDALKAAGGDVQFTRYPDAGHDSWTESYNNPKLYDWFLSHKRGESKTAK